MREPYRTVLADLLARGVLNPDMSVLAVCAGRRDRDTLLGCGFRRVTISNIAAPADPASLAPCAWSRQEAERLTFGDGVFDLCVVHAGLHHCRSPHRALGEMLRVSRRAVLLFEPHDNPLTRLGQRLGVGQEYEHAAVFYNESRQGGVDNSAIPNYVYRWTAREIVKTAKACEPHARHAFVFRPYLDLPWTQLLGRRRRGLATAVRLARPLLELAATLWPGAFGNEIAAAIVKTPGPAGLQPWLEEQDGDVRLKRAWLEARFRPRPAEGADS